MKSFLISLIVFLPIQVFAQPCSDTSETEQWVIVTEGPAELMAWKMNSEETQSITMKDGFELGLKINPVLDEYYRNRLQSRNAMPEMVQITLFDMSVDPPKKLAMNYGGANSIQGYTSRGGASTVEELGTKGFEFMLHKSACVTLESLASK